MADLAITASQVLANTNALVERHEAGAALTPGQAVYLDSDGTWKLAQHDSTAIESGSGGGLAITLSTASAGQDVLLARRGTITLGAGAAPAAGEIYCVSATAGGICPEADVGAADYVSILGVGLSGNKLALVPNASGQVI